MLFLGTKKIKMQTRGVNIGNLIEEMSSLQVQVILRCQIQLTDLPKFCEDFIKEVLNIAFELNLKNLI